MEPGLAGGGTNEPVVSAWAQLPAQGPALGPAREVTPRRVREALGWLPCLSLGETFTNVHVCPAAGRWVPLPSPSRCQAGLGSGCHPARTGGDSASLWRLMGLASSVIYQGRSLGASRDPGTEAAGSCLVQRSPERRSSCFSSRYSPSGNMLCTGTCAGGRLPAEAPSTTLPPAGLSSAESPGPSPVAHTQLHARETPASTATSHPPAAQHPEHGPLPAFPGPLPTRQGARRSAYLE